MKNCRTCHFYPRHLEENINGSKESECRRYPPVLVPHHDHQRTGNQQKAVAWAFPVMSESDGCGEHKPASELQLESQAG